MNVFPPNLYPRPLEPGDHPWDTAPPSLRVVFQLTRAPQTPTGVLPPDWWREADNGAYRIGWSGVWVEERFDRMLMSVAVQALERWESAMDELRALAAIR